MSTKVFDLSRLKQSQVAWLIGKPPVWLRDNGHLFQRDASGFYDARDVFAAVAKVLGAEAIREEERRRVIEYGNAAADSLRELLDSLEHHENDAERQE